jgi:hypothetical protein
MNDFVGAFAVEFSRIGRVNPSLSRYFLKVWPFASYSFPLGISHTTASRIHMTIPAILVFFLGVRRQ